MGLREKEKKFGGLSRCVIK